jgi:hypothetical protein
VMFPHWGPLLFGQLFLCTFGVAFGFTPANLLQNFIYRLVEERKGITLAKILLVLSSSI